MVWRKKNQSKFFQYHIQSKQFYIQVHLQALTRAEVLTLPAFCWYCKRLTVPDDFFVLSNSAAHYDLNNYNTNLFTSKRIIKKLCVQYWLNPKITKQQNFSCNQRIRLSISTSLLYRIHYFNIDYANLENQEEYKLRYFAANQIRTTDEG
jgi:hypothetical protein